MTHVTSGTQAISPQEGPTGTVTSLRVPLCENTSTQESDLRSMVEEKTFEALSKQFLRKRPQHTFCVSEPDEDEDVLSSTFPRKLWKIVGSDQFKSVRWDETGTFIVIDEELFKKEVLEINAPFRIFATRSMKSLVRQLNLYGFSKLRHCVQRSASLAEFLAEEREAPVLSKILYYHNPNFQRDCPQLLVKMKRRVGIKTASPVYLIDQDSSRKSFDEGRNVNKHNPGLAAENREHDLLSGSTNLNVPPPETSMSQITVNTNGPVRAAFHPLSNLIDSARRNVADGHAIFNQLNVSSVHAPYSYSPASSLNVHFVKTITFIGQCPVISPLQNNCSGILMPTSTFSSQDPQLSHSELPSPNLQSRSNTWYQMPRIVADTATGSFQFSNHQLSSVYEYLPHTN